MGKTFSVKKVEENEVNYDCKSIGECVNYAIETGHHEAFAEFFLKGAQVKFRKELFVDAFYKKLVKDKGRLVYNRKNKVTNSTKSIIMKSQYWRNNTCKCCEKTVLTMGAINKWLRGDREPDKDELVQIGLCVGWGLDVVNQLLELSGQRQLYPVDIVDAIGMYYLELYKDNEKLSEQEKLEETKKQINFKLEQLGNPKINEASKPIGYDSGHDIKKEIESIKKELGIGEQEFITQYVGRKLINVIGNKEDFDEFINNKNIRDIVSKRQYGYLRKTLEFIDDSHRYKKNLFYSGYVFSTKLSAEKIKCMIDNGQKHVLLKHKSDIDSRERDAKLRFLNGIWRFTSTDKRKGAIECPTSSRFVVKDLIKGRSIKIKEEENGEKEYIYTISNNEVLNLIKFAIVAGREDEIGEYLIRSGHKKDNINNLLEQVNNKNKEWEKTECLIIYCLCFRDKLIEKWTDILEGENKTNNEKKDELLTQVTKTWTQQEMKEEFPMIELLFEVNKAIQEHKDYKNNTDYQTGKNKHITGKISCLLYPVDEETLLD